MGRLLCFISVRKLARSESGADLVRRMTISYVLSSYFSPSLYTIDFVLFKPQRKRTMPSQFFLLTLCALSAVFALSIPHSAQSRLPSVPQHDEPHNARVMLAFSAKESDGEHQVEIPLGERVSAGTYNNKLITPPVAEKVHRRRFTEPPKDNEDSGISKRTRLRSATRRARKNPVSLRVCA